MSNQLQITGAAKIRSIQGPVVANSGVITALDGDASQYVRGDGTLADFPTSTGGGSSVSYYLNTSVSQGTIGGVAYKQLSKVPISGAGTDVTISANGYIASYLTDANDPALLEVPAGNFNCEFYFSVNSNAHNPYVYAEVYKYDGTTFTLLGSSVSVPEYLTNGTTLSPYYFAIPVATSVLTITDRIAVRIFVNVDGRTVTLHTENNHLCQVVTTFSKGLTTLNSLTRQVQFFQTGTSGTDFAISSSVATHTFNLPVASASNTGKLSSTDWSTFNGKVPYTGAIASLEMGSGTFGIQTGQFLLFNRNGAAGVGNSSYLAFLNAALTDGIYAQLNASNNIAFYGMTSSVQTSEVASISRAGDFSGNSFIKTGGTSSQFLKADGSVDSTAYGTGSVTSVATSAPLTGGTITTSGTIGITQATTSTNGYLSSTDWNTFNNKGTVTSVAALTLGTSGTDLSSSVATGTTTPVITLNVPTASASNRGALSSADWSTFNNKESVLTFSSPLVRTTNTISIPAATTSVNGYLTSTDWTTFNNKLSTATAASTYVPYTGATASLEMGTGSLGIQAGKFILFNRAGSNTLGAGAYQGFVDAAQANGVYLQLNASNNLAIFGRISGADTLVGFISTSGSFSGTSFVPTGSTIPENGMYLSAANTLNFATNTTNRLVITSAGNVGIGVTPAVVGGIVELALGGATSNPKISGIRDGADAFYIYSDSGGTDLYERRNLYLRFGTNNTERMRIASGGTVTIQVPTSGDAFNILGKANEWTTQIQASTTSGQSFGLKLKGGTTSGDVSFSVNNAADTVNYFKVRGDGQISTSLGTGTVTSTSGVLSVVSDMNLKIEDGYIDSALDKVLKLKPRYFYWKEESTLPTDLRQLGFYAQEVNTALGEEAANTPKENISWGINDRSIIAFLTKAMQEQQELIISLQEQINELKNK
jgi:hypothetical protein